LIHPPFDIDYEPLYDALEENQDRVSMF